MQCPCGSIEFNFVGPEGPEDPDIYIVGEAPGREEIKAKRPFAPRGKAGRLLRKALSDSQLFGVKIRIFNIVACQSKNSDGTNRNPTWEEACNCSELVKNDIRKTRPGMIICLGKSAMTQFCEYSGKIKDNIHKIFDWEGFKLRFFYHPSYINRNGGTSGRVYGEFIKFLNNLDSNTLIPETLIINPADTPDVLNMLSTKKEVGFDIETNGFDPSTSLFEICGIGVASWTQCYYFPGMNDTFLANRGLWLNLLKIPNYVYNMTYEGVALTNVLKASIHEMNFIDSRQYAALRQELQGLKSITKIRAGFPDWDKIVSPLTGAFNELIKVMWPTKKYPRKEFVALEEGGYIGLRNWLKKLGKINKRHEEILWCMSIMEKVLTEEEREDITQKVIQTINHPPPIHKGAYFEWVPIRYIAPYCGTDAYAALYLKKAYEEILGDKEKVAFGYYQSHAKLAVILEKNGVAWDDAFASELDEFYTKELIKKLKTIFANPLYWKKNKLSIHRQIELQSCTSLDSLKGEYNPASPTMGIKFKKALKSDVFDMAHFLWKLTESLNAGQFGEDHPMYSFVKIFAEKLRADASDEEKKKVLAKKRALFQKFMTNVDLRELITNICPLEYMNCADQELQSLDKTAIEWYYDIFTRMGIDVDDPSTWHDEFKLIFDFRWYKKVNKSWTTYVWGSVGRGSAYTVDKDRLGDPTPVREPYQKDITKDQVHLLNTTWNYNGAATRRWRAAMHVVPWNSELRDLQVSRFDDGMIIHADYSQMEIRTFAKMAGEEGMLEVLRQPEGDIHTFVASRVYGVPPEEITTEMRRFSKMASFRILYGSTAFGFATQFLDGDIDKAEKIFNDIYTSFPGIKRYLDEKTQSLIDNGYVEAGWGDRMWIPFEEWDKSSMNRAMREAVNYPIQNYASMLAGYGLYYLDKEIWEAKLDAVLFGFTHDSVDEDNRIKHIFEVLNLIVENMEVRIDREFGVPVRVDVEIGLRGNHLLALNFKERTSDHILAEFKGSKETFDEVHAKLKKHLGSNVKMELTGEAEDDYQSYSELFATHRAFSKDLGRTLKKIKGVLEITT